MSGEDFAPNVKGTNLRVRVTEYNGRERLDVRQMWEPDAGEWAPTKRGISCDVETAPLLIRQMIAAYEKAAHEHFTLKG